MTGQGLTANAQPTASFVVAMDPKHGTGWEIWAATPDHPDQAPHDGVAYIRDSGVEISERCPDALLPFVTELYRRFRAGEPIDPTHRIEWIYGRGPNLIPIRREQEERKAMSTPTDQLARNIVNQLGDLWSPHIPIEVRQATNDEADAFVQRLLVEHETIVLDALAADLREEYERVTAESGAYGQMKYRAALRAAEALTAERAAATHTANGAHPASVSIEDGARS